MENGTEVPHQIKDGAPLGPVFPLLSLYPKEIKPVSYSLTHSSQDMATKEFIDRPMNEENGAYAMEYY